MRDLNDIRKDIDDVDLSIKSLYDKRLSLAREVAEYKIAQNKPVYDKNREDEKINSLISDIKEPELKSGLRELFSQLMADSRRLQYRLIEKETKDSFGFSLLDSYNFSGAKVIYQGEPGAYSQAAAVEFFRDAQSIDNVGTWEAAMEEVKNKKADFCILPIENSTAGSVTEVYDLLARQDLYIIGEQVIPIEHALLSVKGADISGISTIYSHPQALAQCKGFLSSNPHIRVEPVINTAIAAKRVMEEKDPKKAAIAAGINASIYGLDILSSSIQDEDNNSTRFVILSKDKTFLKDSSKITVCFTLIHERGSLYNALSYLSHNGINLSKIESRPIRKTNWEYRFFIDLDGNLKQEKVHSALKSLAGICEDLKVLGNY